MGFGGRKIGAIHLQGLGGAPRTRSRQGKEETLVYLVTRMRDQKGGQRAKMKTTGLGKRGPGPGNGDHFAHFLDGSELHAWLSARQRKLLAQTRRKAFSGSDVRRNLGGPRALSPRTFRLLAEISGGLPHARQVGGGPHAVRRQGFRHADFDTGTLGAG